MNLTQPLLLEDLEELPATTSAIQCRFEAFHEANPHVYDALRTLVFEIVDSGVTRYGIKSLFEILRWQHPVRTHSEAFRLCNDFHSRYARLLIKQEPQLDGFFECRTLREAGEVIE